MRKGSIGERVATARKARGWSVRQLARESSLSDTMIHKIENDKVSPGVEVLSRVADALRVQKGWLFFGDLPDVQIVVSPSFVPTDEAASYKERATGAGHEVPEAAKYLDPDGCLAYLSLVAEPTYRAALEGAPLRDLSIAVQALVGTSPVSLVCLGSGHARYEDRFLNLLLTRCELANIVCVDIAAPLLIVGGRRICETLQTRQWVRSLFIYGDFLTLSWDLALLPGKVNVVTMFGYTFCNLTDDAFLSKLPLNRGDLVILDITTPADPPESDPALSRSIDFRSRLFEFLVSPLLKLHRTDELSIRAVIEPWAFDYQVRMIAEAKTGESYNVGVSKRISVRSLEALAGPHYEVKASFAYSDLRAMVLLQKL